MSSDNHTKQEELRKAICKIFNVFPEELEFNLPGGIGTKKVEQLEQLIEAEVTRRIQETEKEMISIVWKSIGNNIAQDDGRFGSTARMMMNDYIDNQKRRARGLIESRQALTKEK